LEEIWVEVSEANEWIWIEKGVFLMFPSFSDEEWKTYKKIKSLSKSQLIQGIADLEEEKFGLTEEAVNNYFGGRNRADIIPVLLFKDDYPSYTHQGVDPNLPLSKEW
jgi:hypothetical protein